MNYWVYLKNITLKLIPPIFQDFALFPHLNVKENIYFGLNKKDKYDETFVEHIINLHRV